jgi:hypothetical protein
MANAVNMKIVKDSNGMLRVTVDPSKKGVLSSTGKSFRVAYVEESYGGFIKLDDVDPAFKGMMLQFQLLRSVRAAKSSEPEDDDVTPAKPAKKNNKKVVAAPVVAKRGRPKKTIDNVSEETEDAAPPVNKKTPAKAAKNGKAVSRRK